MYVAESKRLTRQGAKKIMMTAVDMAGQAGSQSPVRSWMPVGT
jgi:hypothetical protein